MSILFYKGINKDQLIRHQYNQLFLKFKFGISIFSHYI